MDFTRLQEGLPGCPSDLQLHRLRAGELRGEEAEAARRHVDGCATCSGRVARAAAGFSPWAEPDPVRMLAAIRRGVDERTGRLAQRWRRLARVALAPLGVAALAVVALVALPERDAPATRIKGGPTLHVFRQRGGAAVEALSGDRFSPGEPLQLTVDVPEDSLVQIAGVEADGDLYPIWPPAGAGAAFAPMKAGAGQQVPGAIALDGLPGPETFHVIACPPRPGAPPSCRSRGASEPPACAAGCTSSPFVVRRGD